MIPKLYHSVKACSHVANYNRLLRAVHDLIDDELDWHPYVCPDLSFEQHARAMMTATLLRPCRTRGRAPEEAPAVLQHRAEHHCERMLQWFTGDWRAPRCAYFQRSSSEVVSREDVVSGMTRAFHDAFLELLGCSTPSTSRWYTFEPALTLVCGGLLCHRLLARAFEKAFNRELDVVIEDPRVKQGGEERELSWQEVNSLSLQKAANFLLHEPSAQHMLLTMVATEPLDALNQRLQHLDATSCCLRDLTNSNSGVLVVAQRRLSNLLLDADSPVALHDVFEHFGASQGLEVGAMCDEARALVAGLGAQVSARLESSYFTWPWRLLRCVDPQSSEQDRRKVAEVFLAEEACELDADFSEPLRKGIGSVEELTEPGNVGYDMLDRLARRGRATNMGCERLLAQIRQASPCVKHKPLALRVLHCGLLTQHLKMWRDRGHEFGAASMKRLVHQGVPVRANRKFARKLVQAKSKKKRSHTARHFSWINSELRQWRLSQPHGGVSLNASRQAA